MMAEQVGLIKVTLKLPNSSHLAVVDSGASLSCVAEDIAAQYPSNRREVPPLHLRIGNGEALPVSQALRLPFSAGPANGVHDFVILPGLPVPCLLGLDILRAHNLAIHARTSRLVPGPVAFLTVEAINDFSVPLGDSLTTSERVRLGNLCREFKDVFSSETRPFGRTHMTEHRIDTGSARPICQGLRPTSPADREVIRTEVSKMLDSGAIRPSSSPWASPVVLVTKKDGTTRFCIDFRKINDITKKDVFPLPRTSDLLESLAKGRYFTTLDAAFGYWQIGMDQTDIEKTAFITPEGLYEFLVMPFGLCNAPATYQRFMNALLAGLNWSTCLVYLDDVIIVSATFEEHMRSLREIFERFRKAGILLKVKKCLFGAHVVVWLGFQVSDKGISADPAKIAKLRAFPQPTDKTSLRAFLGLAGYYRRFVKGYSIIAGPLFDLLKDDTPFVWAASQVAAFKAITDAIAQDAVYPHPRFDLPFLVDSDASDVGLGAVLSQVIEGVERPLIFASRRLQPAERPWPIREKEALGIIWALEEFRHFLLGSEFTVRTDHSSLTSLRAAKTGRLARWAIRLAEFGDFGVNHRAGHLHSNCDAFTRLADSDCAPDHATFVALKADSLFSWEDLQVAQATDAWCEEELRAHTLGKRPAFAVSEGVLGITSNPRFRPLLPSSFRDKALRHFHDVSHFGERRTTQLLKERFHWPGLSEDAKLFVKNCVECARRKTTQPKAGLLGSKPPSEPWRVVSVDFCGPYTTSEGGFRFILVFVDNFTKWVELCPTRDQLAATVVKLFFERIIVQHGVPACLLSDRGPQFKSHAVEAICAAFGIRKIFSSAYYPQGDGFAERFMRTLNNSLSILSRKSVSRWAAFVPCIQMAYNASQHSATGFSPFFLNTGRVPNLPGETIQPPQSNGGNYPEAIVETIRNAAEQARGVVEGYWRRMKQRFDRNRKESQIQVGDRVLVRLSDYERRQFHCIKLAPRWSAPAVVTGIKSNGLTFDVKKAGGTSEAVHVTRLLPVPEDARIPEEETPRPVRVPRTWSRFTAYERATKDCDVDTWDEESESEDGGPTPIFDVPAIPSLTRSTGPASGSSSGCYVDVSNSTPSPVDVLSSSATSSFSSVVPSAGDSTWNPSVASDCSPASPSSTNSIPS